MYVVDFRIYSTTFATLSAERIGIYRHTYNMFHLSARHCFFSCCWWSRRPPDIEVALVRYINYALTAGRRNNLRSLASPNRRYKFIFSRPLSHPDFKRTDWAAFEDCCEDGSSGNPTGVTGLDKCLVRAVQEALLVHDPKCRPHGEKLLLFASSYL
jgi:hypothetical protein